MAFKALNPLHTLTEAMHFLFAFSRADLSATSTKDRAAIERSCRAFLDRDVPRGWEESSTLNGVALEALRDATAQFLSEAANNHQLAIAGDLVLSFWAIADGASRRIVVRGDVRSRWLYLTIWTAQLAGLDKIRACPAPDCGRPFFKVTRKEFCSTTCQSRIYMRQRRQAEREKGSRHVTPRKK